MNTPPRIAILRSDAYPADPRVIKEARALIESGYEVDLLCLRDKGQPARETLDGVRIFRAPLSHHRGSQLFYVLEYALSILWMGVLVSFLHLRRRYDLIQVNTLPDALVFATLLPRLLGARILLDLHEPTPELYATKYPGASHSFMFRLHVCIERAAIRYAHHALTVNDAIRERFISRGAPPEKLTVVRNVPDEAVFGQTPLPAPATEGFLVITHGTLQPRYGHEVILRALPSLREKIPGLRVEVIGSGETAAQLQQLACALRVEDLVHFAGSVPLQDMPRRLARAHVGLVPLLPSPFSELCQPNKLFEYVALGVPVIAARFAAMEETFNDSCVRYFIPGDPESLAEALIDLHAHPEKRRALAENARIPYETVRWNATREIYLRAVEQTVKK